MKLLIAEHSGFCFGVQNAVDIADREACNGAYALGKIIHNEHVIKKLESKGLKTVENIEDVECNARVIIRSHGVGKDIYKKAEDYKLNLIDATCPFVKKIHKIVNEHFNKGYHIVIIGQREHPEVIGINGWCENTASIIDEKTDISTLINHDKLCFVAQTTFSMQKYANILKKIEKHQFKTVEIFDTICYTTNMRQSEAKLIAAKSDKVLVAGSKSSSNTNKLFDICKSLCKECFFVENLEALKKINFKPGDTIGIVAGASTPTELIMEVKEYMSQESKGDFSQEFIDGVEESLVSYKEGKRVKGTVIRADANGIHVNIGGKKDGLIPKEEVCLEGNYIPEEFAEGADIEAIITARQDLESGCVLLSKKRLDQIREGDKQVETIRGGEVFEFVADKDTKGGLLGKMGTYTVFIPASQVKDTFVKDLKQFIGKKLRLTALEIDDAKHKIVASQRKVLETEKKEKEEIFWSHVTPDVIVHGKVKRVTNFGAFVSVDGFDCLAHIVDLSWNHIKNVEEVLTINQSYDFLVLSVDKEKGRVSLGYKQLQPHPFAACLERHPIGSITKGKIVSIVPFGAFVEIEPGIEGLVHVSEAAHKFTKDLKELVKIGDEVDVMIMGADEANKKITLSMKACTEPDAVVEIEKAEESVKSTKTEKTEKSGDKGVKKAKAKVSSDEQKEWTEDSSNNPFANLLKDLDVK